MSFCPPGLALWGRHFSFELFAAAMVESSESSNRANEQVSRKEAGQATWNITILLDGTASLTGGPVLDQPFSWHRS